MRKNTPEHRIVNVDALTYAGNLENLSDIPQSDSYAFVRADVATARRWTSCFPGMRLRTW
jgi:dTDP-glucose 4,6-dehydratase